MVVVLVKHPLGTVYSLVDAPTARSIVTGFRVNSQQQVEEVSTDPLAFTAFVTDTVGCQALVKSGVVLSAVHGSSLMVKKMQQ